MAKCALCGRNIVTNGCNYKIVDGQAIHKKCPKPKGSKLSEEDKVARKALLDAVTNYVAFKPSDYYKENPSVNWMKVNQQIKELLGKGYTYEEMLYTLDKVVEDMKAFFGFGSVVNRIDVIIARKRKQDETQKRLKEAEQYEEPIYDTVDLSKMLADDNIW